MQCNIPASCHILLVLCACELVRESNNMHGDGVLVSFTLPCRLPCLLSPPRLFRFPALAVGGGIEMGDELGSSENDWEAQIVDEIDPLHSGRRRIRRRRKLPGEAAPLSIEVEGTVDWAEQARQRACIALQERNPKAASLLKKKIRSPPSKKKTAAKKGRAGIIEAPVKDTFQLPVRRFETPTMEEEAKLDKESNLGNWQEHEGSDRIIFVPEYKNGEEVRERERSFNRRLVEADGALEVLEIVGSATERSRLLGFPSLLSPLNVATALHRIAKHMETSRMSNSERLTFARKRHMAELVCRAMEVLPGCSAQGLANIAWALSKVGGSSWYFSEMDRIAEAAVSRVSEFNAQNVANMTGAYASMQHSVPPLFAHLACHASCVAESFKPQELAQTLWAFAALFQPADPLFDALDRICTRFEEGTERMDSVGSKDKIDRFIKRVADGGSPVESIPSELSKQPSALCIEKPAITEDVETESSTLGKAMQSSKPGTFGHANPLEYATAEQLAKCAWSYAVLNEIERPSFKYLWKILASAGSSNAEDNNHKSNDYSISYLSQVHQVNLCLQYEHSQLGLALRTSLKDRAAEEWEKHKSDMLSTSVHQKDLKWLLISTGQNWVTEYTAADYSLDLALVEAKIALEFDGPSHFTRNIGSPLGHTVLKRRLLAAAGWTVLPISYQEWEELDGEAEQIQYLKGLLKQ